MSIFKCEECGCVENTVLSRYWFRRDDKKRGVSDGRALCTACHPKTRKWHGVFPQEPATGYLLLNDGSLCTPNYIDSEEFKWRAEHQGLKVVEVCK